MKRKAVFLDRDGTLIVDRIYLNDVKQIEYLPGVFTALRLLRDHGYVFLIATNQSGVARGIVDIGNLYAIHSQIKADFAREGVDLLEFYYAPYMTDTNHPLRKPNPGMLERGAWDYNVDLRQSWMVGDRMTDVEAGHRAGCKSALMGVQESPQGSSYAAPEIHAPGLYDVAEQILAFSI
ncbi:MAG: D-glycero-alpha-D-manno-heptose-1,7-bisphosphate 7-phosphatase [Bdellovibrionales bacterium]